MYTDRDACFWQALFFPLNTSSGNKGPHQRSQGRSFIPEQRTAESALRNALSWQLTLKKSCRHNIIPVITEESHNTSRKTITRANLELPKTDLRNLQVLSYVKYETFAVVTAMITVSCMWHRLSRRTCCLHHHSRWASPPSWWSRQRGWPQTWVPFYHSIYNVNIAGGSTPY